VGDELGPGGTLPQRRNVGDAAHDASHCVVGVASVVGGIRPRVSPALEGDVTRSVNGAPTLGRFSVGSLRTLRRRHDRSD